jgi:hypothetical protein
MKLNVSKRALKPATNYLNAQVALCMLWTLAASLMCIFGWIMHSKVKELMESTTSSELIPADYANAQEYSDKIWVYGLGELASAICLGSLFVFLAKYLLETGNAGCMKFCCILDGVCGTCACFEGMGLCILFIMVLVLYSAMSNATKVCEQIDAITTTAAPTASTGTTLAPFKCDEFITGLKPAIGALACLMCCLGTLTLKAAGALCFGAKNAGEVAEIFEDEEYGTTNDFEDEGY